MFEKSTKYEALSALKSEIKSRASESRELNSLIRASSGEERHGIRLQKRRIGENARWLLLAYAWLRGRPYLQVEQRCNREALPGVLLSVKFRLKEVLGENLPEDILQSLYAWSAALEAPAQAAE